MQEISKSLMMINAKRHLNYIMSRFPETRDYLSFDDESPIDGAELKLEEILLYLINTSKEEKYRNSLFIDAIKTLAYEIYMGKQLGDEFLAFVVQNCHNELYNTLMYQIDFSQQGSAYLDYCKRSEKNANLYFYFCHLWIESKQGAKILINKLILDEVHVTRQRSEEEDTKTVSIGYNEKVKYEGKFLTCLLQTCDKELTYEKWFFLIKTCKIFCFESFCADIEFFDNPKFTEILEDSFFTQQKFKFMSSDIKNVGLLYVLFSYMNDQDKCIQEYIEKNDLYSENLEFDIYKVYKNFAFLNGNCDFEKINKILSFSSYLENQDVDVYASLSELRTKTRCQYLNRVFGKEFCVSALTDTTKHNTTLKQTPNTFTGSVDASEVEQNEVYAIPINRNTLIHDIKSVTKMSQILTKNLSPEDCIFVKEAMNAHSKIDDYLFYLELYGIPSCFIPFILHKTYKTNPTKDRIVEPKHLLKDCLEKEFISYLLQTNQVIITEFLKEVHNFLSRCDFKNCIELQDDFYNLTKHFYKDYSLLRLSKGDKNDVKTLLEILEDEEKLDKYDKNTTNMLRFTVCVIKEMVLQKNRYVMNFELTDDVYDLAKYSNPYSAFKVITSHPNAKGLELVKLCDAYQRYKEAHPESSIEYLDAILKQHDCLSPLYFHSQQGLCLKDKDEFIGSAALYLAFKHKRPLKQGKLLEFLKFNNPRMFNTIIKNLESIDKAKNFVFCKTNSKILTIKYMQTTICKFTSFMDFCNEAIEQLGKITVYNECIYSLILLAYEDLKIIIKNNLTEKKLAVYKFIDILSFQASNLLQKDVSTTMSASLCYSKKLYIKITSVYSLKHDDKNIQKFMFCFFLRVLDNITDFTVIRYIEGLFINCSYKFLNLQTFDLVFQRSAAYNFPKIFANKYSVDTYIIKNLRIPNKDLQFELEKKSETIYMLKTRNNTCRNPYTFTIKFDTLNVQNTRLNLFINSSAAIINNFEKDLKTNWRFMDVIKKYNSKIIEIVQTEYD